MRILITGITGFVGSHLADYIVDRNEGHEIYGLCRWRSPRENLANVFDRSGCWKRISATWDPSSGISRPSAPTSSSILRRKSHVLTSFNSPSTITTNIIGTTNLLEAVRITGIDPVIHICSSSEVYGQVTEADIPIRESCPLRPASPYAVGKVGGRHGGIPVLGFPQDPDDPHKDVHAYRPPEGTSSPCRSSPSRWRWPNGVWRSP